jgi:hypothetical protein
LFAILRELWPNRWHRKEVVDNFHDYYQHLRSMTDRLLKGNLT